MRILPNEVERERCKYSDRGPPEHHMRSNRNCQVFTAA